MSVCLQQEPRIGRLPIVLLATPALLPALPRCPARCHRAAVDASPLPLPPGLAACQAKESGSPVVVVIDKEDVTAKVGGRCGGQWAQPTDGFVLLGVCRPRGGGGGGGGCSTCKGVCVGVRTHRVWWGRRPPGKLRIC